MANNRMTEKEKYVTGRVIIQYANFKKPYQYNEKNDPKYSVTVLIPKTNKDEIQNLKNIITKHWKAGNIKNGTSPLKDGEKMISDKKEDGKDIDPLYSEFYQFRSNNSFPVKVVQKDPKLLFMGEDSEVRGYLCRVSVDFYAFKEGKNSGVTSYLRGVQIIEPSGIDIPGNDIAKDFEVEETEEEDLPF